MLFDFNSCSCTKYTISVQFVFLISGSAYCFLFTLLPVLDIYTPSGLNTNYMYLNQSQQTLPNGLVSMCTENVIDILMATYFVYILIFVAAVCCIVQNSHAQTVFVCTPSLSSQISLSSHPHHIASCLFSSRIILFFVR